MLDLYDTFKDTILGKFVDDRAKFFVTNIYTQSSDIINSAITEE